MKADAADAPRTQDAGRVWIPQKRRRMSKRRWRIVNPHWKRRSVRCVVGALRAL